MIDFLFFFATGRQHNTTLRMQWERLTSDMRQNRLGAYCRAIEIAD